MHQPNTDISIFQSKLAHFTDFGYFRSNRRLNTCISTKKIHFCRISGISNPNRRIFPSFPTKSDASARGPPPTPCSHQTRVSAYFDQNRHISRVSCINFSNLKRRFSEKPTAHQTQLSAYFNRNPAYFDQNPHFKHGVRRGRFWHDVHRPLHCSPLTQIQGAVPERTPGHIGAACTTPRIIMLL